MRVTFNNFKFILTTFFSLLCIYNIATAHEYWIEPDAYQFEDGNIEGYLRNGQDFKGGAFPYTDNFVQFTLTNSSGTTDIKNRVGNSPALDLPATIEGLNIASFQNKFDTLKFTKWEKFTSYLENQGLDGIAERHKQRGLPDVDFIEQYARCAKALYQVGEISGEDQLTGLKFEFVAQENPYTLSQNDEITFILYWEKKPLAHRQVQLFAFNGDLRIAKFKTNENGEVTIPLTGGGKFMLSAVHMIDGDNDPETETAEWQSYWASMVFGINGTDDLLADVAEAEKAKQIELPRTK